MSRLKFEKWLAEDTTLSSARDEHGYTDFTVALLWHTWQAARASTEPNWPNHGAAIADPLFHQARGIMGTENYGQEEALRLAILHVLQEARGGD